MTRVFNEATSFKEEMTEGFVAAHGRFVRRAPNASGVVAVGAPTPGKVSVPIGGGSGHHPAFCGVVGQGLADGAVIGDVFTSPSGGPDTASVAHALESSLGTLKRLGGAEPGDNTMTDALQPFVRAFSRLAEGGSGTAGAWGRALPAASEGAEATSGMIGTKGRSSKLGERSRGHRDPGAASMVLVLSAVGEALAEGSGQNVVQQDDSIPGSEEGQV